jgi:type IV pilus assembly protein PilE
MSSYFVKVLQSAPLERAARWRASGGLTLIELMIVVAIVAILAAIALPSYTSYVTKSRAQAATSDLVGMALAMENTFQKTLSYPVYSAYTTIAGGATNFTSWIKWLSDDFPGTIAALPVSPPASNVAKSVIK